MGEGSEIYAPLGQSIFGGLFSSTFITLFFIPVVYRIMENKRQEIR
jgi:HAE1 family hydrophobic/amphiphilic exporter-1